MFTSGLTFGQDQLNNTCLTFFVLDGSRPGADDETVSRQVAQTYCLETGTVYWPGLPGRPQLSLRDNDRLAAFEPMTAEKLAVIAVDSGVVGAETQTPGRVAWPDTAAIVVSPQGFALCWEQGFIRISDAGQLANVYQPLANKDNGWSQYYRTHTHQADTIIVSPGFDGTHPREHGWATGTRPW